MANNKLNSKFTENLGTNKATKAGYVAAGAIGAGAIAFGAINFFESIKIGDAVDAVLDWDTLRATSATLGGALLGYSVYNKAKYQEDVTFKQTRHLSLIAGGFLVGIATLPYLAGAFDSESESLPTNPNQITIETAVNTPQTTQPGTVVVSSAPEGMCEITVPIASNDGLGMSMLQAALNEAGYNAGPVDGKQGSMTNAALLDFKTSNNFDPNEKFNDQMCMALPTLVDGDPETPSLSGGN